jgi:hypothetical protein
MLTRLLAAFLLVLAAFSAPAAANAPHNLRTFALEAGLPAAYDVRLIADTDSPNGAFWPGGTVCFLWSCEEVGPLVYVWAPSDWPREWVLAVLLHEVGHYHQHQEGLIGRAPSAWLEWDADRRSIRALCALGLNGPELHARMLADLWRRGGVVDSRSHGNLFARIEHARSRNCQGEMSAGRVEAA